MENNFCSKLKNTLCLLSICRLIALFSILIVISCILLLFKLYLKLILIWLESQDKYLIATIIIILFMLVSLPISLGYIILVLASGYLFGLYYGLILTVFGANCGLTIAHKLLKMLGHHHAIRHYTRHKMAEAIMHLIAGPLCFKIIFCSRLTPIPFGLQNTIFALSNVDRKTYQLASFLGLFPAQLVGVYAGSTLRSMQDVLESRHFSTPTYLLIFLQLALAVFLLVWLSAKARNELLKALSETDSTLKDINVV